MARTPAAGTSRLTALGGAAATRAPARSEATGLADGALLRLPAASAAAPPWPLLVVFHGAGGSATAGSALLAADADAAGVVLLAPQSVTATWDRVERGFGADLARLDRSLAAVLAAHPVDPARIAFGGFSDGASYALSLGMDNGDHVHHLIAFSPGFAAPAAPRGRPRIFVTHGVDDPVLSIDRCSRRMVPRLRARGYDVTYEEFDGGHVVPPGLASRAMAWLNES